MNLPPPKPNPFTDPSPETGNISEAENPFSISVSEIESPFTVFMSEAENSSVITPSEDEGCKKPARQLLIFLGVAVLLLMFALMGVIGITVALGIIVFCLMMFFA